ncbi:hypothetical protein Cni_G21625 [Canna indica]|uniref:OTU domain-containing protein n=1 Tax=Canna indica TaxID=4628 RepID=A0AAQ3KW62_9LILI|nr:hypothetical protein Cni_G21625 [Canna indica]
MGKLLTNSAAVTETLNPSPSLLQWPEAAPVHSPKDADMAAAAWAGVSGLDEQLRRRLEMIRERGVFWKNPRDAAAPGVAFRLDHGGDVEADGNCLFTAVRRAIGSSVVEVRELRQRAVRRFLEDYGSADGSEKEAVDVAIRHLYSPDLNSGWGVHVVQEVKLLAKKADRESLDAAIQDLVDLGLQRELASESIYKEQCIAISDGLSWAKYMSTSGSLDDEYDIITLQYTDDGLLSIDENRNGIAAAFGDDIAIESLATELQREVYVVQAHGLDAMVDENTCVFFLPHRPRVQICEHPIFLFMKGTGKESFF